MHVSRDTSVIVRAYVRAGSRRRPLPPELAERALAVARPVRVRAIAGEGQTDFAPAEVDKGVGVRALLAGLGIDEDRGREPLAFAVGDTVSDLPMLELAELAVAPGHAGREVRAAGTRIARWPYQAGLASAVGELLGHPPGACAACRAPELDRRARLVLGILAAQERGPTGLLEQALRTTLAARRHGRR